MADDTELLTIDDVLRRLEDPAPGDGHAAGYHALWPLYATGVLTDLATCESAAWDAAFARLEGGDDRPTRVAVIDTSVAHRHPNLEPAVDTDLTVDFFSNRLGTFPFSSPEGRDVIRPLITDAVPPVAGGPVATLFEELSAHLWDEHDRAGQSPAEGEDARILPAVSPVFSAHGTAVAGLIGARPRSAEDFLQAGTALVPLRGSAGSNLPPDVAAIGGFPFAGFDPFCEIVPISTSFDADPEQLILAMLYAHIVSADVIVLARDLPDPLRMGITGGIDPETGGPRRDERSALETALAVEITDRERELWAALRELIPALSLHAPIVAAAGNGADRTMIYPANLAADDNGIVAVGARTETGQRAGYSTRGGEGAQVTVYAPSGDGERLDQELQRLDTISGDYRSLDHSGSYRDRMGTAYHGSGGSARPGPETYTNVDVISTDVPGAAGYTGSVFARTMTACEAILDVASYYCRFSGTSAATAITAGMISLAISAGKLPRGDGRAVKKRIASAGPVDDDRAAPALHWSMFD